MAFEVNILGKKTILVNEGDSILESALEQGIEFPHGCRSGNCGACKTKLLSGKVDMMPYSEFAIEEQELKNEIQKQIQSMPGQQKQVLEYYQKNPSAAASLRGTIYEEKIINLIKTKSTQTKKIISTKEAEQLIKDHHQAHHHSNDKESKKSKKTVKSSKKMKTIRKK